jgi:hypothetical protein
VEVKFLKLAQAEFDDAVAFYESEQPGLGKRFQGEVLRSVSRIIEFPSAYPVLLLRMSILYLRSPAFRSFVRLCIRHRRFINMRLLAACTKGYLLATNSRITIAGFGSFVLPHNQYGQCAHFGRRTRVPRARSRQRYVPRAIPNA